MIFSARQLQDLHRSNGQVTLPAQARLTPLARDWVRSRGIQVVFADAPINALAKPQATLVQPIDFDELSRVAASRALLWWCDGPCGAVKAALMATAHELEISELKIASHPQLLVSAIHELAREI